MKALFILLVIQTFYGPIEGVERDAVTAYLGIPFAQPPVGELAFRAPLPPIPWDTVLIADKGSKNCPQMQNKYSTQNTDPDCLYLNIFVPNEQGNSEIRGSKPVVVWFHGGAYNTGGAGARYKDELRKDELMYELGLFASQTNTIVVSCNYRLNVYGYLNLHDINDRFDANIGVKDQLQALRTTRDIISAFGGDTTNIVLMGQSAGAASVINLMALKDAEPLFQKAIAISPCIDHFLSQEHSRKRVEKFLVHLGIDKKHTNKILSMSIDRLERAVKRFYMSSVLSGETRCPFSPWIDNELFLGYPYITARECTKPLLIGYTSEEARMFTQQVPRAFLPLYSSLTKDYAKHYGLPAFKVPKGEDAYWIRFNEALTDYMFHNPINSFVSHYKGPIQTYEYTYVPEEGKELGCYHWSDIPVLFGLDMKTSPQTNPQIRQKGEEMRLRIKQFIYENESKVEK